MRHLDLFSGIGGFALAASWVWPEHEVVAFCDIDPYATKVLNRHWPDVPVINDVRNITKDTINGTIDLVTGGFPCQPFSQAGKRKGKDDDRYLWPEMLRVITEFRPRFVLGENVSGIYTIDDGMVFDQVCADLERAGYEVWPIRVPASALNAPHRRDRWWFAAYAKRCGSYQPEVPVQQWRQKQTGIDTPWRVVEIWDCTTSEYLRRLHGLSDRMDTSDQKHRLKALGNAIVPQVAAQIMQAMKDADMGVSVRSESDG